MDAGAIPKLTMSAMLSNFFPKLLVTLRRLATAPSKRSKTHGGEEVEGTLVDLPLQGRRNGQKPRRTCCRG